ncbi:MAG: hypothetical protein ACR2N9_11635 [Acidimicrobiia bacterium]
MTRLERLGRWSVDRFIPVLQHSVDAERVFVITHGWAKDAEAAVADAGGDLRVWDAAAVSSKGRRFDGWIEELAAQIMNQIPDAVVLCYSWIDESSTKRGHLRAIQSQRRTTANGQRLAVALGHAMSTGSSARPHLIGYSHGARVMTVAATVLPTPPSHLTLLDSPDGLLPVLGGGLNDLSSLLRVISHRVDDDGSGVRIDNYPSTFGIRYGRQPGLEQILDVVLDPSDQSDTTGSSLLATVASSLSEGHRYAPEWYTDTAKLGLPVGFGWSALVGTGSWPGGGESRQHDPGEPFTLTFDPRETVPGDEPRFGYSMRRNEDEASILTTEGGLATSRAVAWRRRGDQFADLPIRWIEGDANAELRIHLGGRERASSRRGEWDDPIQEIALPVGDIRRGPMSIVVELTSDGPATVEIGAPSAVHHFQLPAFAEIRSWLFPASIAALAGTLFAVSFLGIRRVRQHKYRGRAQ